MVTGEAWGIGILIPAKRLSKRKACNIANAIHEIIASHCGEDDFDMVTSYEIDTPAGRWSGGDDDDLQEFFAEFERVSS